MKKENSRRCGPVIGVALALLPVLGSAEAPAGSAVQAVTALENTFGVHAGERRNHINGVCAGGTFVGLPEPAHRYTRSALFSGEPVAVVARFSTAGGNPQAADAAKTARGLALEFRMRGGGLQHMTLLNTPMFGAAMPQTFIDDIVARKPDPATGQPDPEKIKAFRASHPDSLAQAMYLQTHNPPPSWANSRYYGIHTFKFVSAADKATPVRWRFVPQDGELALSDKDLQTAPKQFLEKKLLERVRRGPVRWDMILTIGQPGDPEDNATLTWPADRQEIKLGTLSIDTATPQHGAECEKINFDPLVLSDGIQPSNDPVLLFRSSAYAVSYGKRLSGQ